MPVNLSSSRGWLGALGTAVAFAALVDEGAIRRANAGDLAAFTNLELAPAVPALVSFPHRATGREVASCPAPSLAPVCPCTVLDDQPELEPYVAIDTSSSVFGRGGLGGDGYRFGLGMAQAVIKERVAAFRDHHNMAGRLTAAKYFNFDDSTRVGDFAPPFEKNRHTNFNVVFDSVRRDHAFLVLVTDGVQSRGLPGVGCKADAQDAQAALDNWLRTYRHASIALVLKPPIVEAEQCWDHRLECSEEFGNRCRKVPWWPPQSPTDEDIESSRRGLAGAIDTALESFARPKIHQELPPADLAGVVMVGRGRRQHCTGIAIRPDVVLTAAHCLPATFVVAGVDGDASIVRRGVAASERHATLDAALIRLDAAFAVTVFPVRTSRDTAAPHGGLRFVGFGAARSDGTGFGHRKDLSLLATGWGCDSRRQRTTGCKPGSELVLPGSAGDDTCYGDSGGPLMELIPWGTGCTWRVVGITSRRVADGKRACGDGGIYTRADVLEPWIKRALKAWRIR